MDNMLPCGNNHFNGCFDFFEWSAPYYENPIDIYCAIKEMGVIGKTVRGIKVIGKVSNQTKPELAIRDRFYEIDEEIDKYCIDIRWAVKACEPLQIIFDDNTALELLPIGKGAMRLATNTIPLDLYDGLNKSNFKADVFFEKIIGEKLMIANERVHTSTMQEFYSATELHKDHKRIETYYEFRLRFTNAVQLRLINKGDSYYTIEITNTEVEYDLDSFTDEMDSRRTKAIFDIDQVFICNGGDSGGTTWIRTYNSNESIDNNLPFYQNFGMSIPFYEFGEYLSSFLRRYYDPSIQPTETYHRHEKYEYEDFGVNLYTFENVRKIIADIRRAVDLLENDYDNPELDDLKNELPWSEYTEKSRSEMTDTELNDIRKNHVPRAVDFYRRFVDRMEKMMALPGRNMVSFAGP